MKVWLAYGCFIGEEEEHKIFATEKQAKKYCDAFLNDPYNKYYYYTEHEVIEGE